MMMEIKKYDGYLNHLLQWKYNEKMSKSVTVPNSRGNEGH